MALALFCAWVTGFLFISEAVYRFFVTKREESSTKKNGKDDIKKLVKRRHEGIVRVCGYHL
jgi:hypothetical protein